MGTLASTIANVRLRIREDKTKYFSDTDFIILTNDTIEMIFNALVGVECKLVLEDSEQTLVAATADYTLTGIVSLVPLLVYVNSVQVPVYSPLLPDQLSYIENTTGITFYNHIDNDVANISYWGPLPIITAVSDTLPWAGDWDQAIMRALVVEAKDIREKKNNDSAALATVIFEQALSLAVNKYGSVPRTIKGTLENNVSVIN